MKTTLKQIRKTRPCGLRLDEDGQRFGYLKLKHHLGRGYGDDTPISLVTVLDSNGLDDAHWCFQAVEGHDREKRLYGVWCVRDRCADFLTDEGSINALRVSELYANGQATVAELAAAEAAAWDAESAAWDAEDADLATAWAAKAATSAAAWDARAAARAARAAAKAATSAAAWDAEDADLATAWAARAATIAAAWDARAAARAARAAARAARETARAAAWDAWAAAEAAQANELRRVCACIDAGEDPYPFKGIGSDSGARPAAQEAA